MNVKELLANKGIEVVSFEELEKQSILSGFGKGKLMVGLFAKTNGYLPIKVKMDGCLDTLYIR